MNRVTQLRTGALSVEQMKQQMAGLPDYRAPSTVPAVKYAKVVKGLWGGTLAPMMSNQASTGRFAGAALSCPATACTGSLQMSKGAESLASRNPDAIENIFCVSGAVEVRYGPELDLSITLGRFDMFSLPKDVRHQLVNVADTATHLVLVLSIEPGGSYNAIFSEERKSGIPQVAAESLGLRFDDKRGVDVDEQVVAGRVTRFATLVPYKKDLNRTSGLPPEATMALSAGSVFPLIVPEGHKGRSRTAPMYGNQGLYISIAECTAGDDGPPPHSHSDTQESFFVLNGSFDICTGFDNESVVQVKAGDLFATPSNLMRTFRNTAAEPSRFLVIIQGPDRMDDLVSFSNRIGEDFSRRFGAEIIDKYAAIKMAFDAEARLGA